MLSPTLQFFDASMYPMRPSLVIMVLGPRPWSLLRMRWFSVRTRDLQTRSCLVKFIAHKGDPYRSRVDRIHLILFLSLGSVDMIGSCKTVLPHNVTFRWDQTTLDFLRDLQSDLSQIDHHSGVSLRDIPVTGITTLFRTILDFYPNDRRTSDVDHDLSFLVKTIGFGSIEVEARFVLAYISELEVKIFMDHFSAALQSILQNLTDPLRDIDLVSPEERQRIIVEMNPMYPPGASLSPANNVTELIEQQARKTPQRIAVRTQCKCLCYASHRWIHPATV
jgi:hypothetical protein